MAKIELKGITWDHSRGYDPLVEASKLYAEKKHVKVTWEKRTLKKFGDQSIENLSNSFDLLIIDHPHCGVAAAQNCVLPLDKFMSSKGFELLRSQSAGPSFDSYNYKGHQWALPIDAAMQCAVYREGLMKGTLPKTWKEVLDMKLLGMALCPTDSLCTFLTLASQYNTPVKERNKILVDEKKGVEIIEMMKLIKARSHPESINWNTIELFDHMTENSDVAYAPLAFCYNNYSRNGFKKYKLFFIHPPETEHVVLGGTGIAVSEKCKEKNKAIRFVSWLCSETVQKGVYVEAQGQPANIIAWNDPKANLLTNNFFKDTLSTLEKAYVRPRFQEWPKFQEHLGNVIYECLSKNVDSLKVIRYVNEEFENINP